MLVPAIIVDAAAKASASSIREPSRWCCNPSVGRTDRGNALDNARARGFLADLLEGDDNETDGHRGLGQFVRLQQEFGVRRPSAEKLVPPRESLVDQQAAGSDRRADVGQDRPPEIVRDDHGAELPASQRKGRAALQIGLDGIHMLVSCECAEPGNVAINRGDREPVLKRQPHVSTRPAGDVQYY